ncbi:hypothetical protein LUZ63_004103 [Rhynchospora breviuscula]|uniref:Dirigent protein n=1 Tax=Rhynchospora breviuscula TaxID=2022672 RepID=A0A9Q0HZC5_9POAL|nr:hypothetical protein LUZ63_004103 [Rhynchospora breviuscula]
MKLNTRRRCGGSYSYQSRGGSSTGSGGARAPPNAVEPMERGPKAKVIGRAQGLHFQAGMKTKMWDNSFSIVFEKGRFKANTSLQVMGPVVENGEWAIVGGTGEFALARGVISKKLIQQKRHGNVMELDIHAFYSPGISWNLGKP